jgi:hypothetical protein
MVVATGLSDVEVGERLRAAARAVDEAELLLAEWTAEWERRRVWAADGSRNASSALSVATGCSVPTARQVLTRAHALPRMPHTTTAARQGRLAIDRVDLLTRAATPARQSLFVRDERLLVGQVAAAVVFDDARRIVDYWCQRADDELGVGAPVESAGRLYLTRNQVSGRGVLDGELDAIGTEIVQRELRRLAEQIRHDDRRHARTRTPAERRAVAMVQMAARSAGADGPTTRPLFEVVVGEDTMRHLCELGSGRVLPPGQLVDWLDTAVFESFLFCDRTTIVSVSHQRTFRGAIRRAINVRDRRCQHSSGCDVTADQCDVDHLHPAAYGGPTSQFNGALGCWPHNRTIRAGTAPAPRPERTITRTHEAIARRRWRIHRIRADMIDDPDHRAA